MYLLSVHREIPDSELEFTFSRSGGPGGQNVNKVNTRVTVRMDILGSGCFSAAEKEKITRKLGNRIDKNGWISVESSRNRTQGMNRTDAVERLALMLSDALKKTRNRVKTSVPRSAHASRLTDKKKRAQVKQQRQKPSDDL